jgi:hypothetical protein
MRVVYKPHDILPNQTLVVPALPIYPVEAAKIDGEFYYTRDQLRAYATDYMMGSPFIVYDYDVFNSLLAEMQASDDVTVKAYANRLSLIRDDIFGKPAPPSEEETFLDNDQTDDEPNPGAPAAD